MDRQFGMARRWPRALRSATVRIAELVPWRAERFDDGLAIAENLLEDPFAMIVGRKLQRLRQLAVERWKIILIGVGNAEIVKQPATDVLDQGARECDRSEEHTSELQSIMRISYDVFCFKKKKIKLPKKE